MAPRRSTPRTKDRQIALQNPRSAPGTLRDPGGRFGKSVRTPVCPCACRAGFWKAGKKAFPRSSTAREKLNSSALFGPGRRWALRVSVRVLQRVLGASRPRYQFPPPATRHSAGSLPRGARMPWLGPGRCSAGPALPGSGLESPLEDLSRPCARRALLLSWIYI